jgi:pimeloyl-ACP methyl ester carboxylesterase
MDASIRPRTMQVNGAELTYVKQGAGDAVVFVHGALGDYRDWLELLPVFAHQYRTIVYSRRRHWPNAWPDDDSSCEAPVRATDLAVLIDALEIAPAHVIGHSYGALTALLLAAEQPNQVRTLVLGEPPSRGSRTICGTRRSSQTLCSDFWLGTEGRGPRRRNTIGSEYPVGAGVGYGASVADQMASGSMLTANSTAGSSSPLVMLRRMPGAGAKKMVCTPGYWTNGGSSGVCSARRR